MNAGDNRVIILSEHGSLKFGQAKHQTKYENTKVCGSSKAVWLHLTAVHVRCTEKNADF